MIRWLKKMLCALAYQKIWRESKSAVSEKVYRSGPPAYRKRTWFALVSESPAPTLLALLSLNLCFFAVVFNWPQIAQRSGAAMIIAGVALEFVGARKTRSMHQSILAKQTVKAAVSATNSRIEDVLGAMYENGAINRPFPVSFHPTASPDSTIHQALDKFEKEDRSFVRIEVVLVATGTLFTSVGDWLTCSLHIWGLSTCST